MDELIELLRTWMDANRRSPLDGTISCKICRALVLEEHASAHYRWHYGGQKVDYQEAASQAMFHDIVPIVPNEAAKP